MVFCYLDGCCVVLCVGCCIGMLGFVTFVGVLTIQCCEICGVVVS